MIRRYYDKKRVTALAMLMVFCFQLIQPTISLALTSGPTQPEVQGFQPAGTSEMVDLFSGDFSYNIPLFELPGPNGGYPFNLSYQSGITMDQEASWVGLGWSLNPGAITRQMRGLPDEFSGDSILTKMSIAPNTTVGAGTGGNFEIFGRALSLGMGLSVYQNSYNGMGYTIDASVGFSKAVSGGSTAGIGLNVSMDSQEGIGVNPSLNLGYKSAQIGLGADYNSKRGLNSLSVSETINRSAHGYEVAQHEKTLTVARTRGLYMSGSATISVSHPGYTPQITMPMKNESFSGLIKVGAGWEGAFLAGYIKGFYNKQTLRDDKKYVKAKTYGYLNYQNSKGAGDLLDMNREKDGMVTQSSPNLAIPSLTYDIYSISGQGIGAMYRPMRNDLGVVRDQEVSSVSVDASGGMDAGIPAHYGTNLSVSHSRSTSGAWKDDNSFASSNFFAHQSIDHAYEPAYFKVHGEPNADNDILYNKLHGDEAVRVSLSGSGASVKAEAGLENKNWSSSLPTSIDSSRKSKNNVIQTITNGQLGSDTSKILPLFKVKYLTSGNTLTSYNRAAHPKHHIAGLTALTPEGLRYNYALPAYNTTQSEVTFSVPKPPADVNRVSVGDTTKLEPTYNYEGTDQFLRIAKMPPYAHSYLLTSIVGPDYVDVTDNGVTADDLGYWVKFTYQQMNSDTNPYKWRDPYFKAHYQEGWKTDPRDGRGNYTYGEKELWYLAKAETKSHIATFKMGTRQDGFGAARQMQNSNKQVGAPLYQLQKIDLYARSAQNNYKIKTVNFDYDYSLCKGASNNPNQDPGNTGTLTGKLTLKRLWFTYGSSNRGKLNPYVFSYNSYNPDYDSYAFDRWGIYKPYPSQDPLQNVDGPYSIQDPNQKSLVDQYASAWSLTDIKLPSGGTLTVNYEADDYAYVQQQPAMQMMELLDPYTDPTHALQENFLLNGDTMKLRFRLEKPIAGVLTAANQKTEVLKYLDQGRGQLYFRIKVNLHKQGDGLFEYVAGYADIDFGAAMGLEKAGGANAKYVYGFFHVKKQNNKYNPLSAMAWQHLRTNQPFFANPGPVQSPANSNRERINQIKSIGIGAIVSEIRQMFQGFQDYCNRAQWGKEVIASKSWIRLNAPDKIKYGGGLRVRQVTIKDEWKHDEEGIYGQVYEYTTIEKQDTISSGVAAYEPITGGEENAVHYAKNFTEAVRMLSDNNLYFEYPINESYYPGPQVGYSKVTVTSLAAAYLAGKPVANIALSNNKTLFPQGANVAYGTTGMTVHEFYTAHDFPVLTDETDKVNKPYKLSVPIPFLGSITVSNLTASQGYSIVTNDMHGKQKRVSNYRQDRTGAIDADPISWVKYNYRADSAINTQGTYRKVWNAFKDNGDGTLSLPSKSESANTSIPKFLVGQEEEFFTDMRQFKDDTWTGGLNLNVDILYFIFAVWPVPTVWPSVSKGTTQLRTTVCNKVIFKTGILESTEAYDEGSHVVTQNLKWDKQTGATLLTRVTNDFNAPVYSYNMPAYTQYQGMGAAYQNAGLTLTLNNVSVISGTNYQFTTGLADGLLYPGDELLLYADNKLTNPVAKAVYTGDGSGATMLNSSVALTQSTYSALVTRSGYRNQLSVMAGSVTALKDPSGTGGSVHGYSQTFKVPKR